MVCPTVSARLQDLMQVNEVQDWQHSWWEIAKQEGGVVWDRLLRVWAKHQRQRLYQLTWQQKHHPAAMAAKQKAAEDRAFRFTGGTPVGGGRATSTSGPAARNQALQPTHAQASAAQRIVAPPAALPPDAQEDQGAAVRRKQICKRSDDWDPSAVRLAYQRRFPLRQMSITDLTTSHVFPSGAECGRHSLAQESQELRSQGQAGQLPFQAIKRAFQRNSGDNGSEDKFERLLRFSFYQATALDHLQNGAVIVFVLFAEALQKGMSAGYLVGHPSRNVTFLTSLEGIRMLPFAKDPTVASALDTLEGFDVDEVLRLSIGNFAPRHATPKQGEVEGARCDSIGLDYSRITGKFPGYLSPSAGLKFADVPNGLAAISK
ncbi:FCPA, partial [Symbiodinium sp. KB8]